jgi:hypothetical protein
MDFEAHFLYFLAITSVKCKLKTNYFNCQNLMKPILAFLAAISIKQILVD